MTSTIFLQTKPEGLDPVAALLRLSPPDSRDLAIMALTN